ncbi:MAG: hypothetical protein JWP69_991 [Flaviaesturariibacter sp.]|nr:hypothetical protein [Flaviaesturariibacter sp.]
MRVNGNHIDRLVYSILPLIICVGVLFYLFNPTKGTIIGFSITAVAYWAMDTIILRFKRPKTLEIDGNRMRVGNELIDPRDIQSITPVTDNRYRWSFELVKIQCSTIDEITIIDRPSPFWYFGDRSKSVDILLSYFPFLDEKVRGRHSH